MRLILDHNKGSKWESGKDLSVKGYAFTPEGRFLRVDELLQYLSIVLKHEENLVSALKQLNGIFSLVYTSGTDVYIYCDKSRFFPVFYRVVPDLVISDEPETLLLDNDTVNNAACEEFRFTGYTTGTNTLVQDIQQVPPGELLTISQNLCIKRAKVFSYQVKPEELRYDQDPVSAMAAAIEKAAARFIQSIGDATPVLPLSGGYDSRLIACILKAHGYSNTVCFTYGKKTKEVDISKQVADLLGFRWYFVNYETLADTWLSLNDEVFIRYYRYASKLTSMFYLQEYPAVIYLMQHSLIPENSIFLPGHSGDLLGGSQFTKVFPVHLRHDHIIDLLIQKKYINFPTRGLSLESFRSGLRAGLDLHKEYMPYSILEDWDIREKIAKFIINSSQIFTFFGYQVRFLFWDDELVEFFRCLPPEYKNHKRFYNRCLKEKYFARYGLNLMKELTPGPGTLFLQRLKELVKPFLPRLIQFRYMLKNDWACYHKFTRPMLEEIDIPLRRKLPYNGFNSVLINWYLKEVKKNLTQNT